MDDNLFSSPPPSTPMASSSANAMSPPASVEAAEPVVATPTKAPAKKRKAKPSPDDGDEADDETPANKKAKATATPKSATTATKPRQRKVSASPTDRYMLYSSDSLYSPQTKR